MEDNVALDSSKQKQFVKSVKGIKKLLKGKGKGKKSQDSKKEDNVKIGKVRKPKPRGLVYLSHIPHGFYEHQMTEYFKQFGVVTNARVIRSKRTGMSKGHAFVEFKDPTVAEIVAETMNNYLMGKRLIKAALVPPGKQRRMARRKNWNAQFNPGNNLRQKMKKIHNEGKTESEELKIARKLLSNLSKTKQKLREIGIDYDFFMPVDIPEELMNKIAIKKEEDIKPPKTTKNETDSKNSVKVEETTVVSKKKNKRNKSAQIETKKESTKTTKQPSESTTNKKSKVQKETEKLATDKVNKKDTTVSKTDKKDVKGTKADKTVKTVKDKAGKAGKKLEEENKSSKVQEEKEKKLNDAGVKPVENFIKIQNESTDESDGSMDFDSDEFEKMIGQDVSDVQSDDEGSSDETDDDLDENITSEEESVIDIPPPKKVKGPVVQKNQIAQTKKQESKPKASKQPPQPPKPMKSIPQSKAKPSKKPKFEKKGNQKTLNKVIKKKK